MIGDRGHDLKDQDKILLGIKILPRQFRQKCLAAIPFFHNGSVHVTHNCVTESEDHVKDYELRLTEA